MRSLSPFLALVASAACVDIKIFWQHAKSSSRTLLSVFDGSELVAQTCSSIIAGTPRSIDFSDLDDNGSGNFSIGDAKYLAHSNPEYSGGPICTKKYNADVAVVECSDVNWAPSADAAIEENCHEDENIRATIQFFTSRNREKAHESTGVPRIKRKVSSRQCQIETTTSLIGDGKTPPQQSPPFPLPPCAPTWAHNVNLGNPHQNFYDKQLSVRGAFTSSLRKRLP